MLNTADLSLEQAPPISIPFRFFLTAPLFGLAGGVLLLLSAPEMFSSRWTPAMLALTHLYTLGVLAMVMCGAMMQMLPVLAGAPVPRVVLVGNLVHPLLSAGTVMLAAAFLTGSGMAMAVAASALGSAFLIFLAAVATALRRIKVPNETITGMRAALVALLITVALGSLLAAVLSGLTPGMNLVLYTDLHLSWGMLGWVALLVVAVSYQVVPMFQVTPEYPPWLRRRLVPLLLTSLVVWTLLTFMGDKDYLPKSIATLLFIIPLLGLLLFTTVTLRLQQQRRRRISDVTLLFWRSGLAAMVGCGAVWISARFSPALEQAQATPLVIGIGLVLGAAVSLLNGMLYKIVPFLSWFHLQNRQLALMCMTVQVPNMKQLLPDRVAKRQFRVHLAALLALLAAVFQPKWFIYPAGVLLSLSSLLLWINLLRVVLGYRRSNRELLQASHEQPPLSQAGAAS
jgi:hypothetical protein